VARHGVFFNQVVIAVDEDVLSEKRVLFREFCFFFCLTGAFLFSPILQAVTPANFFFRFVPLPVWSNRNVACLGLVRLGRRATTSPLVVAGGDKDIFFIFCFNGIPWK